MYEANCGWAAVGSLLKKDPAERLNITDCKLHSWVTTELGALQDQQVVHNTQCLPANDPGSACLPVPVCVCLCVSVSACACVSVPPFCVSFTVSGNRGFDAGGACCETDN